MVYELLNVGAQNAQSAKELASVLQVDPRTVSEFVERERREGKPICATCRGSNAGYFIPANRSEMHDYCGALLHRINEITETFKACVRAARNL